MEFHMIPAPYIAIWRAMSPEEKKAEKILWLKDCLGGFGLIGFMCAGFYIVAWAARVCTALGWCA